MEFAGETRTIDWKSSKRTKSDAFRGASRYGLPALDAEHLIDGGKSVLGTSGDDAQVGSW